MRVPGHQRKSYTWRWTAALAGLAVLSFALVMALVVTPSTEVRADARTWVVDRTDDPNTGADGNGDGMWDAGPGTSGCVQATANDCTLRGAIERANLNLAPHGAAPPHPDTINFGTLTGTIPLAGGAGAALVLNDATGAGTTIDGPGGPTSFPLVVNGGGALSCFIVLSPNNTIRDLGITNCNAGVVMAGAPAHHNRVLGNTIYGIAVTGVGISGGANNTIGTTAAADRNVIRDNPGGTAVWMLGVGTTANTIQGNYIGTDATGNVAAANGTGISGSGGAGGNSILNNVVSTSVGDGINVTGSSNNVIQGNLIGVGANGFTGLANGGDGIDINTLASGNLVGGTVAQANVIAYSGGNGVLVTGAVGTDHNRIRRNPIFLNGGLGISLAGAGGNDLVGPPVISVINFAAGQHVISGTVPLTYPSGSEVDVFKADAVGQGRQYLGTALVTNAAGTATWSISLCGFAVGDQAVATATDTTGNTSQFSLPSSTITVGTCTVAPTPTITTTPAATAVPAATNTTVPSATPSRTPTPAATATPTTAPTESVTLVAGCNPVASTYPDDTPTATIAGAVSPSTNLISIWWLDTANGRWLGYSPQFVAESDLTSVDRLEAIFICVSAASTWSRPQI